MVLSQLQLLVSNALGGSKTGSAAVITRFHSRLQQITAHRGVPVVLIGELLGHAGLALERSALLKFLCDSMANAAPASALLFIVRIVILFFAPVCLG